MTLVRFQQFTVRTKNAYHCACGHKYYRQMSDWYTMNPFHNMTHQECRDKIIKAQLAEKRDCPKCKCSNSPVVKTQKNDNTTIQ